MEGRYNNRQERIKTSPLRPESTDREDADFFFSESDDAQNKLAGRMPDIRSKKKEDTVSKQSDSFFLSDNAWEEEKE